MIDGVYRTARIASQEGPTEHGCERSRAARRLARVSAEDQIRRTLARYIHSHDRNDPDGVMAEFTEGARLLVPSGARPAGRAAIRAFMEDQYTRRRAAKRRMKHLYGNSDIEVRGTAATVVSDWVAYESV